MTSIRSYYTAEIPGLLQTPEYASRFCAGQWLGNTALAFTMTAPSGPCQVECPLPKTRKRLFANIVIISGFSQVEMLLLASHSSIFRLAPKA